MALHNDYLPKAYFEGQIIDFADAKISVATSGLQYGIGCFAGIRGYLQDDGSVALFRLDRHAQRLRQSIKMLGFKLEISADQIANIILETVQSNSPTKNIYVRPFVYKSDQNLGPKISGDYQLCVYVMNLDDYVDSTKGLNLMTSSWIRVPDHAIPSKAKATGAYINAALSIDEAESHGFDSSIMMDHKGDIGEGVVMNLFLVRENILITPQLGGDLLEGITRRSVIELAEDEGITVQNVNLRRSQMYSVSEAFVTGTAVKVGFIRSIDNRIISETAGVITTKISKRFNDVVTGKDNFSKSWLTKI